MADLDLHRLGSGNATVLTTYAYGAADGKHIAPDIEAGIRNYKRNEFPFLTLVEGGAKAEAGIKVRNVGRLDFDHLAEFPLPEAFTQESDALASATTLTLTDASGVAVSHVLTNPRTNEQIFVVSISSNTITCRRAVGDVPAAAVSAGDTWLVSGTAGSEAQAPFSGVVRDPLAGTLYAQEFGWGLSMSEWQELTTMHAMSEWERLNSQSLTEYRRLQENALILGQPYFNATAGLDDKRLSKTAGLYYFCRRSGNRFDFNNNLTEYSLANAIRQTAAWCTDRNGFLAVCSSAMMDKISMLPGFNSKIRYTETTDTYGFSLSKVKFASGSVKFLPHRMMDVPQMEDKIMIVNMSDLRKCVFRGPKVRQNLEDPAGRHVKRVEWSVIYGLDNVNPMGCGLIERAL